MTQPYYIHHLRWKIARGDQTKRESVSLSPNALVFDGGGYRGEWTESIYNKFASQIFVFEPIAEYADVIRNKFQGNDDIQIFQFGLGKQNEKINISIGEDGSSVFKNSGASTAIDIKDIKEVLDQADIEAVDLLKLNIEGGEYAVLDRLIETGYISKINQLHVQFHHFVDDAKNKRRSIRNALKQTHECEWNYPFVWESWKIKQ